MIRPAALGRELSLTTGRTRPNSAGQPVGFSMAAIGVDRSFQPGLDDNEVGADWCVPCEFEVTAIFAVSRYHLGFPRVKKSRPR